MKKIIMLMVLAIISMAINAETYKIKSLTENEAMIDVSRVKDSIVLGANKTKDLEIRLITTYLGQSFDVAPKYNLYLNYFHGGNVIDGEEQDRMNGIINSTRTAFDLGLFMEVKSTKRIKAGVYEIKAIRFTNILPSMVRDVTLTIDTTQVSEKDYYLYLPAETDPYFESTITVDEK